METPDATQQPSSAREEGSGALRDISDRIRGLSPGFFGVIVLCFVLPFVSVMCTGATLITMKGTDFVFGGTVEVNQEIEETFDDPFGLGVLDEENGEGSEDLTPPSDELPETEDVDPNIFAIVAFGAAVAGTLIGLVIRGARRDLILTLLAGATLLALLIFRFDIGGDTEGAPVTIEFRYGWWTAVLLATTVGAAHFEARRRTRPSKDALRSDHGPPPGRGV